MTTTLVCRWCAGPVTPWAASEFFPDTCAPCNRQLDDSFILGFGLQDGVHFTRDGAGDIEYWLGDDTLAASCVWLRVHEQALEQGLLERESLADFVLWTQRCLQLFHGPVFAPPFAVPAGDLYEGADDD